MNKIWDITFDNVFLYYSCATICGTTTGSASAELPLDVGELEGLRITGFAHEQHKDLAVGIVDQFPSAKHVDTILIATIIIGHLLGTVPGGIGHGAPGG